MPSATPSAILSLAKDLHSGRAIAIVGYGEGVQTPKGRWNGETIYGPITGKFDANITSPSLNFGHLLDRLHPDFIGFSAYEQLLDSGLKLIAAGNFYLPHPKCIYVHHFVEDSDDFERTYYVILEQVGKDVLGSEFVRQKAPANTGLNRCIKTCFSFEIANGHDINVNYEILVPVGPRYAIDTLEKQAGLVVNDMVVATTLLLSPRKLAEQQPSPSFAIKNYNRSRKFGLPKLETPIVVHPNRQVLQSGSTVSYPVAGSPKTGHERRAHVRVLWRGTEREREVPVKATQVNGGKLMQAYVIAPANHTR